MDTNTWRYTDYYKDFRCKCGDCRHACCIGWNIAVREAEYYEMIGRDCSPDLHHRIECAFGLPPLPTSDRFRLIEPNWLGQCHMLDEDGLCMLQKECGAEAIPELCRVYPRSLRQVGDIKTASCSAACEGVVELLLKSTRLTLVDGPLDAVPEIITSTATAVDPLINQTPTHLSVSMACLLESIRLLTEEAPSLEPYTQEVLARYTQTSAPTWDREPIYLRDLSDLYTNYPDFDQWAENLIANNLIYVNYPYCDPRIEPDQAGLGLSLQYDLLMLFAACHHATKEDLVDVIAEVYHLVEHTAFYFNAVVIGRRLLI